MTEAHWKARAVAAEAELTQVQDKLLSGTLHVVYCNGRRDEPVGSLGCNCPVGLELKALRRKIYDAQVEAGRLWGHLTREPAFDSYERLRLILERPIEAPQIKQNQQVSGLKAE